MNNNPFTSSTFERIWIKHYGIGQNILSFNFIEDLKFTHSKWFPYYINLGKNFTNGITYKINLNASDYKGKVFLLHDVPDFYEVGIDGSHQMKLKKVRQYEGYYGSLTNIESVENILGTFFNSSKSKYNFKRNLRQLDENIDSGYQVYFGAIDKADYDREMRVFKALLSKRFDDKSVFNTVLPMWSFYEELIYPLILEKRVVLNVIYDGNEPIAMSINFLNDRRLSVAIRTFDIAYNKLNIGNIEIYKLIEWCIDNNIEILDFSKGENEYKKRWTTTKYFYDCHVLYDSKSIKATIIGNCLSYFFMFKQYLREKKVNSLYMRLKYVKKAIFQKKKTAF